MSSIVIAGDTSGSVTLQAPAVAGSTVITLPSTSTTLVSSQWTTSGSNIFYNTGSVGVGAAPDSTFYVGGGALGTVRFFYNGTSINYNDVDTQIWRTAAASEIMRLTSTGLGIGTSSPQLKFVVSNAGAQGFEINPNSGLVSGGIDILCYNRATAAYKPVFNNAEYHVWATSTTERARIDSSGNLLVGTTTAIDVTSGTADGQSLYSGGRTDISRNGNPPVNLRRRSSDGSIMQFFRDTTNVGTISVTTTATAYNTSSDYRLKNTIAPMTGALSKIALLKPCTYKWNVDGSDGEGFIAHELAEVCPDAVTGAKDAVDAEGNPQYQGIDTSFLVATLTAAIQEQQALITTLTERITALEGV